LHPGEEGLRHNVGKPDPVLRAIKDLGGGGHPGRGDAEEDRLATPGSYGAGYLDRR